MEGKTQKYVERKNAKTTKVWMNNISTHSCPGYEDGFPIPRRQVALVPEHRTVAPNVCLHASCELSGAQNCEAANRFF
jgi:uncharacterized protein YbbK (DUF523 family)